ncbi:minor tail protein [Arthrobacter phage Thunderclap]|uniref:Minor tail protein n=6 Tax=Amigovirus amigo TaxID=1982100 RepID=A0A5J6TBK8_9CAUD|nr:tail protein [Arthrobacter phage Amigo]QFG08313.1 minor tail protein [Arthrobacter phage Yeezus]QFG13361.1 minor tail protein [Arthrobacter phage Ichor]QFG13879.1 minor tail protein [Arthrobacter phage Jaek]QJD51666.1 minor tail protein [Arthrobacter phage Boersma]QOR56074.1 minor tail protein [Arthrobacter phage Thunderclap]
MVNILDFGTTKAALLTAIASGAKSIYFPEGEYNYTGAAIYLDRPINLYGDGKGASIIKLTEGFRTNSGGLNVRDLEFVATTTSGSNIAFKTHYPDDKWALADMVGFTFDNVRFRGFFYSTYLAAANYGYASDPSFVPVGLVKNVKITNSDSYAPSTGNAGHFQHLRAYDVELIGNSTYGGAGATSYNFIGGNGYLRVVGNYDEKNSYGSCQIENQSGKSVVSGNTFGKKLWIDDSSNVAVTGNVIDGELHISIQNYDVKNVVATGNVLGRVIIGKFGDAQAQTNPLSMDAIIVNDNVIGGTGNYGLFISDDNNRIWRIDVDHNTFVGEHTSGTIGVVRASNQYIRLTSNIMINNPLDFGKRTIITSGSGGYILNSGNV